MKNLITILFGAFFLLNCNNPDKILTDDERMSLQKHENDSLMIIFDSLMQVKIDIPQLVDTNIISAECLKDFTRLARETDGEMKILINSKLVSKAIVDLIHKHSSDNSDLMILIDKTSSMMDDFEDIKKSLDQILSTLKQYKNIRLSIGTYGDKNVDGKIWYDFQNFENDFSTTSKFIKKIQLTGGGDYPESVYDGVYEAFQENFWKSDSKRMVILIGDAPSLNDSLSSHSLEEIISIAKKEKINMNFYPILLSPYPSDMLDENQPRMEKINFITNLYPNPTNGPLSIDLLNEKGLTIELVDQNGKIVFTTKTLNAHEILDLYDQPNGLYIMRVYDEFKNYDENKIIINK